MEQQLQLQLQSNQNFYIENYVNNERRWEKRIVEEMNR